jgi:hexosaminidase
VQPWLLLTLPTTTNTNTITIMGRFAALLSLALLAVSPVSALWPLPAQLQSGSTPLTLSPSFHISISASGASADLHAAAAATAQRLKADKLGRLVPGRGAGDAPALAHAHALPSLTLALAPGTSHLSASIAQDAIGPLGKRDEAYALSVPADGKGAVLTAKSALGLFRGLSTFEQMWYSYESKIYTVEAPYTITDAPAYVCVSGFLPPQRRLTCIPAVSRFHARHRPQLVRISLPTQRPQC